MGIVLPALIMTGTGLLCAAVLVVAARFFAVQEDPRVEAVAGVLPGANCGGCTYAGCWEYARAIVLDDAPINQCGPGGADVTRKLASLLGREAVVAEKKVALVLCGGDNTLTARKFRYNGIADCAAAALVNGGEKLCSYGCLGYGTCARACPSGAIEITPRQLAVVHPDLCIGCGACVRACPRKLIRMVPESRRIHVLCSSRDKGPFVKQACKVGCIACTLCTKLADNGAIRMDGALAVVDYTKDLTNEAVVEKCPGRCIVKR